MLAEPEVAVIVTVPFRTVVTRPADETVTTEVADEVQVTDGLEITVPTASFTVAVKVVVSASEVKLRLVGDSVTLDAT